jgi:glycosyltransferase involved in cell wall biosynthesis
MRVTCLTKRWDHHTESGGYDRLATAVGANVVRREVVGQLGLKIARKLWLRRTRTGAYLLDYQFGDFLAELKALTGAFFAPPMVFHVLYGDEQLDQLIKYRALLRCPLAVSFHLPNYRVADRFEVSQPSIGKKIDAAIVLATDQVRHFARWIDPERIVYVPHGIDAERFCPTERASDREGLKLLVVGSHMRDWAVTHNVIDRIAQLGIPVEFHVVTRWPYYYHLTGCRNVIFHCDISESELIALYRGSDALLLPVVDSTANNSVLEALACGTPVISTFVGGMPDYVDENCGWLFAKGEVEPIVRLVERLHLEPKHAASRKSNARRRALKFDWAEIAKRMGAVYKALAEGRAPAEALSDPAELSMCGPQQELSRHLVSSR